jgi:hypothetical protein
VETLGEMGPSGRSLGHWGHAHEGIVDPLPLAYKWKKFPDHEMNRFALLHSCHNVLPHHRPKTTGPIDHALEL